MTVFIPQHPIALPKQIDASKITVPSGEWQWDHLVDTRGGSSGAPVISMSSGKTVGIHLGSHGTSVAPLCPNRLSSMKIIFPIIKDHVGESPPACIPTLSEWSLITLVFILVLMGALLMARRRRLEAE